MTDSAPAPVTHLSRERLYNISAAHGTTDAQFVKRAVEVAQAIAEGVDVKTMAADLADAARADKSINAVGQAMLGYAKFASTAADLMGIPLRTWAKTAPAEVASVQRLAKRVGVKRAGEVVRDTLKPLADDVTAAERASLAVTALDAEGDKVLPEKVPTPRKKVDPGKVPAGAIDLDALTGEQALTLLRAVTHYLSAGGSHTADLASAGAEFAKAMSDARKRGAEAARRSHGETVETIAA